MRYYKYQNTDATEVLKRKEDIAELIGEQQKNERKNKIFSNLAFALAWPIGGGCFFCCLLLLRQIPMPEMLIFAILHAVALLLLGFLAALFSFLVGVIFLFEVNEKVNKRYPISKRRILSQASAHLREFYELQEPCIVTKCYESSDKKFTNHDVCIYVVGEELRITTNLIHGFFNEKNDLGCYAFRLDEITLAKKQGEKILIAELKSDNMYFHLGYRAKGFIDKNFIMKE